MLIWGIIVAAILIFKYMLGDLDTSRKKKVFLIFVGLIFTFVFGSRNGTLNLGSDLNGYFVLFEKLQKLPLDKVIDFSEQEKGYYVFNKLLGSVFPWNQTIIYFETAFVTFCTFRMIYKYSENVFLSVILYMVVGNMLFNLSGFRQAIAMGICLISIDFIKDKKLVRFILLVILATLFHQSAIVFLPMYFVANRRPSVVNNFLSFGLTIAGIFFAVQFLGVGNDTFDREYSVGFNGNLLNGVVPIIAFLFAIVVYNGWGKGVNKQLNFNKVNTLFYNMLLIGFAIYIMRYQILPAERIAFYFTSAVIVLLPNSIKLLNKNDGQIVEVVAIVLAIALLAWRIYLHQGLEINFFWN